MGCIDVIINKGGLTIQTSLKCRTSAVLSKPPGITARLSLICPICGNFREANGKYFITSDNKYFNVV